MFTDLQLQKLANDKDGSATLNHSLEVQLLAQLILELKKFKIDLIKEFKEVYEYGVME